MFLTHHDAPLSITVIDEDLIVKSIEEETYSESKAQANASGSGNPVSSIGGPGGTSIGGGRKGVSGVRGAGRSRDPNQQDEPIVLEEVTVLRLSYKNILKIDNLVGLGMLHTLCLDNNIIEDISGIEHLVNLQWLDLSFNNITEIKGLEKLSKLQDLSLFNNNISKIENLQGCISSLEVLSIGNNNISKLDSLLYLRQFKKLNLVNFEGNPVCSDPEYRMYVLAYLSSLKYLDYALIDSNEVISAKEQYQDELLELQEREALEEANKQTTENQEQYFDRLRKTNLYVVETLFAEMFKADNEYQKFKMLPGFETIMDSYQHEFRQQVETMITDGLELFEKANCETNRFQTVVDKVISKNEQKSIGLIEQFNRNKKILFRQLQKNDIDRSDSQTRLEKLDEERKALGDTLLSIEMQQVEQLNALRDTFENRSAAIKSTRLDRAQLFFRAVEDLENSWFNTTEELVATLLEKVNNNEAVEEATDEAMAVLSDKETLLVATQSSHDIHLGKLLAQEDNFRESMIKDYNKLQADTKESHTKLNRERVSEIQRLLQQASKEINAIFSDDQAEEEDYV